MSTDLRLHTRPTSTRENPLAAIQAMLRKFPHARTEWSGTHVTVHPLDADGFVVGFEERGGMWRVQCAGWYEDFHDPATAVDCFLRALSTDCRLRVEMRGRVSCGWQLQVWSDEAWSGLSEVARVVFPYWLPSRVVYLQNNLLEAA